MRPHFDTVYLNAEKMNDPELWITSASAIGPVFGSVRTILPQEVNVFGGGGVADSRLVAAVRCVLPSGQNLSGKRRSEAEGAAVSAVQTIEPGVRVRKRLILSSFRPSGVAKPGLY
jgi:hypothetical protein